MTGPPDVTVVIPTRDRWSLLDRALRSALAQRDVTAEIVVVDDGSASPMPEQLARRLPSTVRVIELPSSGGVARARNRAIAEARGAWIAFLDDDDLWAPDKLRRQLDATGAGVALVYAAAIMIDGQARMTGVRPAPPPSELDPGLLETNLVGSPSGVLARTDLVRRVGGFDPALSVLADWDLWIRLLQTGSARACAEPLVGYTVHPGNMHLGNPAGLRRELRMLRRKHARACAAAGVRPGGRAFSRWLVARYRDAGLRGEAARVYARLGVRYGAPRDLARAPLMLLGEGAMGVARRGRPRRPAGRLGPAPEWLADQGMR
jgi:glycosyltransferase involved in cell wall biosynthesis